MRPPAPRVTHPRATLSPSCLRLADSAWAESAIHHPQSEAASVPAARQTARDARAEVESQRNQSRKPARRSAAAATIRRYQIPIVEYRLSSLSLFFSFDRLLLSKSTYKRARPPSSKSASHDAPQSCGAIKALCSTTAFSISSRTRIHSAIKSTPQHHSQCSTTSALFQGRSVFQDSASCGSRLQYLERSQLSGLAATLAS